MADELKPCPKCSAQNGYTTAVGENERPGQRILRGLEDAVAFAQGDTTRGRIIHPQPKGGDANEARSTSSSPDATSPGVTAGASDAELIAKLREHATDWDGRQMPDLEPAKGDPTAGTLRESAARLASLSAEVERLIGYYAQVMSGQSVAIITRLETSERALAAEREAHHRDVRQFSELADAQRRRAEAAESDARKMREALEPFAKIAGKTGTIDAGSLDAMMFRARAALKETDQ